MIERICFGKKITLNVWESNGSNYIDCLVRERCIMLLPEEEIRQLVLTYIYRYSKIDIEKFLIKVEHNSLDIAFYLNYSQLSFSPSQCPHIIFEVKRAFTYLSDCSDQLENYMRRFKCQYGVLTNGNEILFVENRTSFKDIQVNIQQLEERINNIPLNVIEDKNNFELAQNGEVEAFLYLIRKFGKTSKFTFVSQEYPIPVTAFFFELISDRIFFNFCNVVSSRKQPKILKQNFLKLISITE